MKHIGDVMGSDEELKTMMERVGVLISTHACTKCGVHTGDVYPGGVCSVCHERAERARAVASAMLQLPPTYRGKKWTDVETVGNLAYVKSWVDSSSRERKGIYLHGPTGSGKTLLTAVAFGYVAWRGVPVRWIRMVDLLTSIRRAYDPGAQTSDDGVISSLAYYAQIGILMVDDFGAERMTGWVEEKVYDLIDRIYGNGGCLWLTSNLSLDDMSQRVGDRVASRLAEMCGLVRVDAPDYRVRRMEG